MVKFVKSEMGNYYNVFSISYFYVVKKRESWCVKAVIENGSEPCIQSGLECEEDAQSWLDNFIEELEF